jgi:hypothetical protein
MLLLLWRVFSILWDIIAAVIAFLWFSPLITGAGKASEVAGGSKREYFLTVLKFSVLWIIVYAVVYGLGSWIHGAVLP